MLAFYESCPTMKIYNARLLQDQCGSPAEFFQQYGFCLLNHKTEVQEWNTDYKNSDNDIVNIYQEEIKALIREQVFPPSSCSEEIADFKLENSVLTRGKDQSVSFYATAIHQDYGQGYEEYANNLYSFTGSKTLTEQYKEKYLDPEIKGHRVVCFWRPIKMAGPLKSKPLVLCDPRTVSLSDVVPTSLVGFSPVMLPSSQASLKFHPRHKWYYFPDMTNDEVICFKQFECMKGIDDQPDAPYKTCFHTAIDDPTTPKGAEPRKSCEYRVGVFFK